MKILLLLILAAPVSQLMGQSKTVRKSTPSTTSNKRPIKPIRTTEVPSRLEPMSSCNSEKINLRGLRVGDSKEKVFKAIEPRNSNASWVFEPTAPEFQDISLAFLSFHKNRIYELSFGYKTDEDVKWENIKEFTDVLSETWAIPKDDWELKADQTASLYCGDLTVQASISSLPSITILNRVMLSEAMEDRNKVTEAKKKGFKP